MTYINPLPGRTGHLWNNIPRRFLPSLPSRFALMLNAYVPRRVFITLLLIMSCFITSGALMAVNRTLGTTLTYLVLLAFVTLMGLVAAIDGWIIERRKKRLVTQVAPLNIIAADGDTNIAGASALTPPESAEAFIGDRDRREAFLIRNAGRDEDGMPIGAPPPTNEVSEDVGISTITLELDIDNINDDKNTNKSVDMSLEEEKKVPSPSYRIRAASSTMHGGSNVASPMYSDSKNQNENEFSFPLGNQNEEHGFENLQLEAFGVDTGQRNEMGRTDHTIGIKSHETRGPE